MKAPWTRLPLFTFFLAAGLMMAGQGLSLPRVTYLGAFALGFTAFVAGIEVIRTKKAFFLPTGAQSLRRHSESYSGVAARLWGVFFTLAGFGAMLASGAAVRNPQSLTDFFNAAFDNGWGWGALLIAIGVFVSLWGAARLLAGSAAVSRRGFGSLVRHAGFRVVGGVSLLIGLGLIALGLLLLTAPDLPAKWLQHVI